jgi:hypothetical protein
MGDLIFLSRDDLQYVLDGLSHRENKQHFRQSLIKATAASHRMTPHLMRWLEIVLERPEHATQLGNPLKTTACLFLLASLGERKALPSILALMQMEDPGYYDLVEEEAIESASRILAAVSEPDELMQIAQDSRNGLELRENCIDALLLHYTQDLLDFEDLSEFLYDQWRIFRSDDYEFWRTCLLTSFYVADERHYGEIQLLAPRIKESYGQDLIQMLKSKDQPDGSTVRANLFACPEFQPIRDPVSELRDMVVFDMIESIAADVRRHDIEDLVDEEDQTVATRTLRFRVRPFAISDFSCSIELLDIHDLHDLHLAIQEALHWDADHCYSFFLDNRFLGSEQPYEAPADGGEETLIQLSHFQFKVGQEFAYVFDWSEERKFTVQVEAILPIDDESEETTRFIPLIERRGTPPLQYSHKPHRS